MSPVTLNGRVIRLAGLSLALIRLDRSGLNESPMANTVVDLMEESWYATTKHEREFLSFLAGRIGDDMPPDDVDLIAMLAEFNTP